VSQTPGRVFAWGTFLNKRRVPVPAEAASQGVVRQIESGLNHVLALTQDGRVIAWGSNISGQLPPASLGLQGVQSASAGSAHSLLLLSNGTVVCFGDNAAGQCDVPRTVAGSQLLAKRIATSQDMSFAQLPNGSWVYWGKDMAIDEQLQGAVWSPLGGQLSFGVLPPPTADNTTFAAGWEANGTANRSATINGAAHLEPNITSVVLSVDDVSFLMLDSATGQLHRRYNPQLIPIEVQEASISHACTWSVKLDLFLFWPMAAAVSDDGSVWAWSLSGARYPAPVKAQGRTRNVICGHGLVIALLEGGDVEAWGPMVDAGVLPPLPSPAELASGGGVVSAAAGYNFAVLLLANGTVVPVGRPRGRSTSVPGSSSGQGSLTRPIVGSPNITALIGGARFAVVASSDGDMTVLGGDAWMSAATLPAELRAAAAATNGTLQMAAGAGHVVALLPDGSLMQWCVTLCEPAGHEPCGHVMMP
jgi:hypothetical protein